MTALLLNQATYIDREHEAFQDYRLRNKRLFENKVISSFFGNPYHVYLFVNMICEPSIDKKMELEMTFRKFYFCIRFTKYLCSLIKFADVDYHRKRKKQEDRNPLVFDTPMGEEGDMTLGELLLFISVQPELGLPQRNPDIFQSAIEDPKLFTVFSRLTSKQKQVITLAYDAGVLDTEIASVLMVSQQAITKTRRTALEKMKRELVVLLNLNCQGDG
ncbi:hypothetical protein ACP8HI_09965 [Paenibacillus sp. FA6]|uniref:hypothetical protein n=1 Tax=Paenibacillus sp. FA6 TaxID=3413029 RepID=UPI003F65E386